MQGTIGLLAPGADPLIPLAWPGTNLNNPLGQACHSGAAVLKEAILDPEMICDRAQVLSGS